MQSKQEITERTENRQGVKGTIPPPRQRTPNGALFKSRKAQFHPLFTPFPPVLQKEKGSVPHNRIFILLSRIVPEAAVEACRNRRATAVFCIPPSVLSLAVTTTQEFGRLQHLTLLLAFPLTCDIFPRVRLSRACSLKVPDFSAKE